MGVRGRSPRKKFRYSDVKNEILAKYNKFYEYDVEDDVSIGTSLKSKWRLGGGAPGKFSDIIA